MNKLFSSFLESTLKRCALMAVATVALITLLTPAPASAQLNYAVANALLTGGTNNVAATATNSYVTAAGNIINVTRQTEVRIEVKFKGSSSGTGNLRFDFDESLDKTDWANVTSQNVAFNGTTAITNFFTITPHGSGFLRLNAIGNTNSIYGTNLFLQYAVKTGL